MSAPPRLPLLKRVPPGFWTALTWCAALAHPVVEYVLLPRQGEISYAYPADGLDSPRARLLLALAVVLALAGSALLRRRPVAGFVLLTAGTVLTTAAWQQREIPPVQFLAADVALGFVAAACPRRKSLAAAGLAAAVLAGYYAHQLLRPDDGIPPEPYLALTVVIAWLVGNSARQSRVYAETLSAQAAAQAVTAERLRIARELHDMVAHSIGIIALQAGAAARVIDTQPSGAREALGAIETAGRETLSGLRRMLGALREAEPGRPPRAAPPEPGLGLADVERLAATTTAAGVRVDVVRRGEARPLPPEIDVSAYRVVQEAVTNVVRHSGADSCRVTIDRRAGELRLEVADDGPPPGRGTGSGPHTDGRPRGRDTGWGIIGMRERVGLLHGEFAAGPRAEGGFLVSALLPVPAEPGTEAPAPDAVPEAAPVPDAATAPDAAPAPDPAAAPDPAPTPLPDAAPEATPVPEAALFPDAAPVRGAGTTPAAAR
ncbi:sensor histidine kinase [Streptomyces sp. Ru87]|uniref:sensor histidine kinase n=1 Tax=Streptomyces sp. Ru87 TaxID=2044307 RepID=UPI001C552D7E|nr:sensor histidine kinase [Streptomyces sp. Ru87]